MCMCLCAGEKGRDRGEISYTNYLSLRGKTVGSLFDFHS